MTRSTVIIWALALLNVALLAFILTSALRPAPVVMGPGQVGQPFGILTDLESLSASDRRAVRRTLMQRLPEMRAAATTTRAAADQMAGVFRAEVFDADAARAAADEVGRARAAQWAVGSDIIIDIVGGLPDAARQELMRRRAELNEARWEGLPQHNLDGLLDSDARRALAGNSSFPVRGDSPEARRP